MTDKKIITTTDAQKDFDEKTAQVAAAESAVEQAQQAKIKADAKTLDAIDADLDKALIAASVAAAKVNVLQQRLAACRDRLALAAATVKDAQATELEAAATLAVSKLAEEDEAITATVQDLVGQLASAWTAARSIYLAASAAASAAAKAKGVPVIAPRGLIAEQVKTTPNGNVDALASSKALLDFLAGAPGREAEKRAREEQRVADKFTRDLRGEHGPEAQNAARITARDQMVASGARYVGTDIVGRPHVQAPVPRSESDIFEEAVG